MRSRRLLLPGADFLRIAERDQWMCHWCNVGYMPGDPWEIDHATPVARGGTNHAANLRLCHRSCNKAKGTLVEAQTT